MRYPPGVPHSAQGFGLAGPVPPALQHQQHLLASLQEPGNSQAMVELTQTG